MTIDIGGFVEADWRHARRLEPMLGYCEAEARRQCGHRPMASHEGISMPPALLSLVPCRMQTFPRRLNHIVERFCSQYIPGRLKVMYRFPSICLQLPSSLL